MTAGWLGPDGITYAREADYRDSWGVFYEACERLERANVRRWRVYFVDGGGRRALVSSHDNRGEAVEAVHHCAAGCRMAVNGAAELVDALTVRVTDTDGRVVTWRVVEPDAEPVDDAQDAPDAELSDPAGTVKDVNEDTKEEPVNPIESPHVDIDDWDDQHDGTYQRMHAADFGAVRVIRWEKDPGDGTPPVLEPLAEALIDKEDIGASSSANLVARLRVIANEITAAANYVEAVSR